MSKSKNTSPQISELKLDSLIPYARNPRINDAAVDGVAASIKEFGFINPIVVDADNVIVCGHTRYKAAQKLGLEHVPCILVSDLTPEQVKAYRIMDNRTSELSHWDDSLLAEEITASAFPPHFFELEEITKTENELEKWDFTPTRDETIITIRGSIIDQAEIRKRLQGIQGIEITAVQIII